MDEVSPFTENELVDSTFIDGFLNNAVKEILMKVPLRIITPAILSATGQISNTDGTGQLLIPSEYLRLWSFKMEEWDEAVTTAITPEHWKYKLQKFTITRGKPSKPVVVEITSHPKGVSSITRYLKYYSVLSNHTVEDAYYVKYVVAETLQETLTDVLAYQVAGNVFLSQNRQDMAKAMYDKVGEFIITNK